MTAKPHNIVTEETSKDFNHCFSLRLWDLPQHTNHSNRVSCVHFFPPLHPDAVVLVLSPVIYINVSPSHLFSCHVKSTLLLNVAPAPAGSLHVSVYSSA